MNVLFDNVDFGSNSGPNAFAGKLAKAFSELDINAVNNISKSQKIDIQLSFIASSYKVAPIVQRLDGIYFNSDQDYQSLNTPICETFHAASAVIYQSDFNKKLTDKWFGEHENGNVIHNGTCLDVISKIQPMQNPVLDKFSDVWSCASSWRPHKRLSENVRYFLESAPTDACLVIAGQNPDFQAKNDRVLYAGELQWQDLISLFKRSSKFLHLSWLDHCPNVVIDAQASGCSVVCSSSGGTHEIVNENGTIIEEDLWDLSPIRLYNPPKMDFSRESQSENSADLDITDVAEKYKDVFMNLLESV